MKFNITLTTLGYIILGIIATFLFAGIYAFFKLEDYSRDMAYETGLRESQRYAETLKSFRGLYTSEVITEVIAQKQMKITHDYKDSKYDSTGAIPLPATLSMMLAEKMTTDNTTVKLYSKYPFPWRRDREVTEFEDRAFEHFEKNRDSDEPFYELDKEHGVVRYAIPDKMVTMSCVNCHNNHPQSPKTDWVLGDVRGAISIVKPVNATTATQGASGTFLMLAIIGIFVFIALAVCIYRIKKVRNAIKATKANIEQLKVGDLPEERLKVPENEMKEVINGLNILQDNFRRAASFAQRVGKGELDAEFHKLGDKDLLGIALIEMRNNLQKASEEDARRNWVTAGLAQLGETLRENQNGTTTLYDKIIQFVVKYTNSNQAGLFVIGDDNSNNEEYLELVACYAYERKKYLNKRVDKGEGMIGQCFLEGEVIYITQIPKDYVKITSGLGEALPGSLLLIPMKVNDKVYGIIEMLSFNKYEPHEIEFMKKVAENIASVISTAKVNERTRSLLAQAQQQTEEMRSQEEEMRQNMEELAATQEEMARKEREYVSRIKELTEQMSHV
ncbi:MAG: c-type heme family protein [Bacteroidota bacterium]